MSDHTHDKSHAHSDGGPKLYAATLGALLVLTAITVFAAGFNFGNGNVVIALAIATVKASLVALIFMHLRHDKPINSVILLSGFLFLGLLLLFCLTDAGTRPVLIPGTLKVKTTIPAQAPVLTDEVKH